MRLTRIGQQLGEHVGKADHLGDHGEIWRMIEPDIEFSDPATADTDFETVRLLATRLDVVDDSIEPMFHIL